MERMRHSRSVGRSRREERRSGSIRSSHESMAGNLSPGRHHEHHGHRRSGREGGFFKNLFGGGRRDKRQQQQEQEQSQYQQLHPSDGSPPPPAPPSAPPRSMSPAAKLKALLSFAPHSPSRQSGSSPTQARGRDGPADDMVVKDMQHRMQLMQAQVQDYERLKAQLAVEQRAAAEWKEKWNYQNFKLNLMVDMLVLRVLELDQAAAGGSHSR